MKKFLAFILTAIMLCMSTVLVFAEYRDYITLGDFIAYKGRGQMPYSAPTDIKVISGNYDSEKQWCEYSADIDKTELMSALNTVLIDEECSEEFSSEDFYRLFDEDSITLYIYINNDYTNTHVLNISSEGYVFSPTLMTIYNEKYLKENTDAKQIYFKLKNPEVLFDWLESNLQKSDISDMDLESYNTVCYRYPNISVYKFLRKNAHTIDFVEYSEEIHSYNSYDETYGIFFDDFPEEFKERVEHHTNYAVEHGCIIKQIRTKLPDGNYAMIWERVLASIARDDFKLYDGMSRNIFFYDSNGKYLYNIPLADRNDDSSNIKVAHDIGYADGKLYVQYGGNVNGPYDNRLALGVAYLDENNNFVDVYGTQNVKLSSVPQETNNGRAYTGSYIMIGERFRKILREENIKDGEIPLYFNYSKDGIYNIRIKYPAAALSYINAIDGLRTKNINSLRIVDSINDEKIYYFDKSDLNKIWDEQISLPTYVAYNDQILAFDTPPVIENDRTLIPLRFLFETMGAEVSWNSDTNEATVKYADKTVTVQIDNNIATINGEEYQLDVPARLINDKTMVPLRFISEGLGFTVDWDEENRIAEIR